MNSQDKRGKVHQSEFRKGLERLMDTLDRHIVALTIVPEDGGLCERLGSGVLVRREGRNGIVTAAHVALPIREALDNPAGSVPWMVGSARNTKEKPQDGAVSAIRLKLRSHRLHIEGGRHCRARDADVAWIPLPTDMAEQLEAETVHGFYEWEGRPPVERGNYHHFVTGCVGAQSRRILVELGERALISEFRQVKCEEFPECDRREGWDYLTVTADKSSERDIQERVRHPGTPTAVWEALEEHPSSYRGVSGGPLWWMMEGESGEIDSRTNRPVLWGIVFSQWGEDANDGIQLNCHGPESIERITSVDYSHTTPSPSPSRM